MIWLCLRVFGTASKCCAMFLALVVLKGMHCPIELEATNCTKRLGGLCSASCLFRSVFLGLCDTGRVSSYRACVKRSQTIEATQSRVSTFLQMSMHLWLCHNILTRITTETHHCINGCSLALSARSLSRKCV